MSSLTLTAKPDRAKLAIGKKQEAHLLITLGGQKVDAQRKPLDLAAVVDVSGSMAGAKIGYAKKTLQKLIENLGAEDTLGAAAYATEVEVLWEPMKMTPENKARAKAAAEALSDRDSTNLSGGTLKGFEMLKDASRDLRRVFLMTDGMANVGVSDIPGLVSLVDRRPKGTSLTAFGYGSDYNVELLQSMAKAGGGQAYHVKSADELPQHFGRELGGLLFCVAQTVKVTVAVKPDFRILEVLNDFDVKSNKEETEAVITVDDVYAEEKRHILLRVEMPEMEKGVANRPFKFADVKVEFQDLVAKEPRSEETAVKVEFVSEKDAQKDPDTDVREQIVLLEAARAQEEARKLAEAGRFDEAKGVVRNMCLTAQALGTPLGHKMAKNLQEQVMCSLSPSAYAGGGSHMLRSNIRSYQYGRAQNMGTSAMFDTKEQKLMAGRFEGDQDPLGAAPSVPDVQAPAHPAKPARPHHGPKPAGLSKKKSRRS